MIKPAKNTLNKIINQKLFEKAEGVGFQFDLVQGVATSSKGQTSLAADVVYTNPTVTSQLYPTTRPTRPGGYQRPNRPGDVSDVFIPPDVLSIEDFMDAYGPVNNQNYAYDLNNDGVVDGNDLGIFLASLNTGSPGNIPDLAGGVEDFMYMYGPVNNQNYAYDLNGDGVVDGADLGIYMSMWQEWPTGGPLVPSGEEETEGGPGETEGEEIETEGEEIETEGEEIETEDEELEFPTIQYAGNFIAAYGGLSFNPFTDPNFLQNLYAYYSYFCYFYGPEGASYFEQYYGDPSNLFGEDNIIDLSDWEPPFGPPEPPDPLSVQIESGSITPQEAIDELLEFLGYAAGSPLITDPYYLAQYDFNGDGIINGQDIRAIKDAYGI